MSIQQPGQGAESAEALPRADEEHNKSHRSCPARPWRPFSVSTIHRQWFPALPPRWPEGRRPQHRDHSSSNLPSFVLTSFRVG